MDMRNNKRKDVIEEWRRRREKEKKRWHRPWNMKYILHMHGFGNKLFGWHSVTNPCFLLHTNRIQQYSTKHGGREYKTIRNLYTRQGIQKQN